MIIALIGFGYLGVVFVLVALVIGGNRKQLPIPTRNDEEEFEPECECIQTDVDMMDARYCPTHGPSGDVAKRQKRQEADDEANFWQGMEPF